MSGPVENGPSTTSGPVDTGPSTTSRPFFSVLVTAYNRAHELPRCLDSCRRQPFGDYEIVVVDDGSTDDTGAVLAALDEPRLRVVRHDRNRGISPARATGARHARGEWLVVLDSDWELMPGALTRLKEIIDARPPEVRIIRSRLQADTGELQPGVLPSGVTGYEGRLQWCNAVDSAGASSDAGHCIHRSVVERENFISDRRGGVETLWELDVARWAPTLWVPDVLGVQHADAVNSHTRDHDARRLVPRLLQEAPDMQWTTETLLERHREGLERFAPHYGMSVEKYAGHSAFLAGDRMAGVRHTVRVMRRRSARDPALWLTLVLGLIGPRALAYGQVLYRRWSGRR